MLSVESVQPGGEEPLIYRKVRTELQEEADRVLSMVEAVDSYVKNRSAQIEERTSYFQNATYNWDNQYKWSQPCGWDATGVFARCSQQMVPEKVSTFLARPRCDLQQSGDILKSFSSGTELPRGKFLVLKEEAKALNPHQDTAVHDLSSVTTSLYQFLHVDVLAHVKADLAELDAQRAKLLRDIEHAEAELELASKLQDVVQMEAAYKVLVDLRYALCELYAKRMNYATLSNDDDNNFKNQLAELLKDAESTYDAFDTEKKVALRLCGEDIALCKKTRDEEQRKADQAKAAFGDWAAKNKVSMDQNITEQAAVLQAMRELSARLLGLCNNRRQLVHDRIAAKEAEERRIYALAEFNAKLDEREHVLHQVQDYLRGTSQLASDLLDYLAVMSKKIRERDIGSLIAGLINEESSNYLNEYKKYVYCSGDLTTKKHHRFDTLERQSRVTQLHRGTAVDSLDPRLPQYEAELQAITATLRTTEGIITSLHAQQDSAEQLFKPTEVILRTNRGPAFVHPVVEFTTKSVEDRKLFVEKSLRFVEDEERCVERQKEDIQKLRGAAEGVIVQHEQNVQSLLRAL
jgi:hypothetical protein